MHVDVYCGCVCVEVSFKFFYQPQYKLKISSTFAQCILVTNKNYALKRHA